MKYTLEELIRRYSQAVEEAAPPVEELMPPEMADQLGLEQTSVLVTELTLATSREGRYPGWVVAVAVAIAIAILAIPVILLTNDPPPVVDTPPSTTVAITTTVANATTVPTPLGDPALEYDRSSGTLSGTSWSPGSTVTATLGDQQRTVTVDPDGNFTAPTADFVKCCFDELVVTDGISTLVVQDVPDMEVTRVDPVRDVIAGFSWDGPDVQLTILGGEEPFTTSVSPQDNSWFIDLGDEFDLVPGMVVEARAVFPQIVVTHRSGEQISPAFRFKLTTNEITGDQFSPQSPITVTVGDDELLAATNARGEFSLSLSDYGLNLDPGVAVRVDDGISTRAGAVPTLTYDIFDADSGQAAGVTDMLDGTQLYVELWMSSDGTSEANEYVIVFAVVTDGRWVANFDPIPDGWRVISTDVGGAPDGLYEVDLAIVP